MDFTKPILLGTFLISTWDKFHDAKILDEEQGPVA